MNATHSKMATGQQIIGEKRNPCHAVTALWLRFGVAQKNLFEFRERSLCGFNRLGQGWGQGLMRDGLETLSKKEE